MILHVTILLAIVIYAITLFVITLIKKSVYRSPVFPFMFLALAVYVLGFVFEAFASNIAQGYASVIVKYFGIPYVTPLLLLTLLDYYNRRPKLPISMLLFLPPVVTTILVATWPVNGIYYSRATLVSNEFFTQLQIQPTTTYFVLLSYSYILYVTIFIVAVKFGLGNPVRRKNTTIILLAMIIPVIFNIVYVLGWTPYGLDFQPYAFPFTLMILSYSIFRLDALDILPQAKELFLENMDDALIVIDRKRWYIYSNNAAKKLFPVLQNADEEVPLANLLPAVDESMKIEAGHEIELPGEDGRDLYYYFTQKHIAHKTKTVGYCLMLHDITEDKNKIEKLQADAEYDGLTKIYNHNTFNELAKGSMQIAGAEHVNSCVFYIDLDHFKDINDTYGHLCGDMVLQKVTETIKKILRRSDLFGRLGGDEFGIFFMNITEDAALGLAEKIRESVSEVSTIYQGITIKTTISVGVALSEKQSPQFYEKLLENADLALYKAKRRGRNRVEVWMGM